MKRAFDGQVGNGLGNEYLRATWFYSDIQELVGKAIGSKK